MSNKFQPDSKDIALGIIDMQQNMLNHIREDIVQQVKGNIGLLIKAAKLMHIPVTTIEMYTRGMGGTSPDIIEKLGELYQPYEKITFNACSMTSIVERAKSLGVIHWIICGTEAHVCVLQTVLGLLSSGYEVSVVSDAVCSRFKSDWEGALRLAEQAGAVITTTEIILFTLLKRADTPEFKTMSPLLKYRLPLEIRRVRDEGKPM